MTEHGGGGPAREPIEELAESFIERFRRGESPSISEYTDRHPEIADRIRGLLSGSFSDTPGDGDGGSHTPPESGSASRPPPPHSARPQGIAGLAAPTASRRAYSLGVARIGLQVAEALSYAHGEGILHRDIKPSNLILDTSGHVWITDFGLAKTMGSPGLTLAGDIVGTLRYMAPERLDGWSDPRSDVYGLGITIYELLTLRPAFEESSRERLIKKVSGEEPPHSRKISAVSSKTERSSPVPRAGGAGGAGRHVLAAYLRGKGTPVEWKDGAPIRCPRPAFEGRRDPPDPRSAQRGHRVPAARGSAAGGDVGCAWQILLRSGWPIRTLRPCCRRSQGDHPDSKGDASRRARHVARLR